MLRSKGWYGVDFDGTLCSDLNYAGPLSVGEPIPKMVERVKAWLAKGHEVRIFTARVSKTKGDRDVEEVRKVIEDWCEKHIGQRLQVTNEKDFSLIELWDDRAVGVIPNTGERTDGKE